MTKKYPKIVDQSGYLAKILIVDQIGLPVDEVVSGLLSQGYLIYYKSDIDISTDQLKQTPNFYPVTPEETVTLSLIDYLFILKKPNQKLSLLNLPHGYKTFIYYQLSDKNILPDATEPFIQSVYYEEILSQSLNNKLDQLINLRQEGSLLFLKKESRYYPVFPSVIGKSIQQLINQPITNPKIFLSAGEFTWTSLIDQINNSTVNKPKNKIDLSIPIFQPPVIPRLNVTVGADLVIKKRINDSISNGHSKTIQRTARQRTVNLPTSKKLLTLVNQTIRRLNKIMIHHRNTAPETVQAQRKGYQDDQPSAKPIGLNFKLIIFLLIITNSVVLGRFYSEKLVNKRLSTYEKTLTEGNLTAIRLALASIASWEKLPLSWLISPKAKSKIPSKTVNTLISEWIAQSENAMKLEQSLINQWRLGNRIEESDWNNLSDSYQQAQLSAAAIKNKSGDTYEKLPLITDLTERYAKMNDAIGLGKLMIGERPVRLLVLLQNNYELRPTGGLVSAYGIITLQNGHNPTWQFFDSSVLDQKMTGKIQPPTELINQLGETQWFFRDINWEPDSALSAEKITWFYENAEKTLVDGVIFSTTDFWQQLYELNISTTTSKTENVFFTDLVTASAEQKQSLASGPFLAKYASYTLSQLFELSELPELSDVIYSSFENKNLVLYLKDSEQQITLAKLGWDGKIKKFIQPESKNKIIADYLMVNEANTGINLVNRFIDRQIIHQVKFTGNQKDTTLTLTYNNNSSLTSWPGGEYQAYVRLYLPQTISLNSFSVNDGGSYKVQESNKINGGQFDDKAIFGFRITIPPGQQASYQIVYTDQGFTVQDKLATYLLLVQKQPGVSNQRYQLLISSDKALTPLRSIPDGKINNNAISVIRDIEKDTIFQIDFGQ